MEITRIGTLGSFMCYINKSREFVITHYSKYECQTEETTKKEIQDGSIKIKTFKTEDDIFWAYDVCKSD